MRRNELPDTCLSVLASTGQLIIIKKESMAIIRPIGTPEIGQKTGKSLTPTTSGAAFRIFRRQP